MNAMHYLGGLFRPGKSWHGGEPTWAYQDDNATLFLEQNGFDCHAESDEAVAVLVRGPTCMTGLSGNGVAEAIRRHYLERGGLPVDRLEGCFTVLLLDGRNARVLLYRGLAGNGFTYYTRDADGFRFGSNLAALVDASASAPRPNSDVLPAFFLYRFVPGRETLFEGIQRLMPGEQVSYDANGLRRTQPRTFADLAGSHSPGSNLVDEVEQTIGRVVRDYARLVPRTANLLSGGVDSSFLQAMWNRADEGPPLSYSVSVCHSRTRMDTEYALSMAKVLGTRHTLVPADGPYADYLIESIAATGEPPNHVFAAYFGHLARTMAEQGMEAGLCGEGADSLFGIGTADELGKAGLLRALVPFGPLRRWGGRLAAAAGRQRLAYYLGLAERLHDLTDPEHPVNQVAAFADWPATRHGFGEAAVRAACGYRRGLLSPYRVPSDLREQFHACAYLGEAIDSASLWTTLYNQAGLNLFCPFLDSRVLRLALSIPPKQRFPRGQPKGLLKQALARHVPAELVYRKKLGFGQPIFEWLAPGGQLRPCVERIGHYDFVPAATRAAALARPSWFLYSLLCYDLWHKLFIERGIPRERPSFATLRRSAVGADAS